MSIKTFMSDVDVVIGRGDFNLKGLRYEVSGNGLYIREDEARLRSFLGSQFDGIFSDCSTLCLSEDHFEGYSQFNPFDLDRREKAIEVLSKEHPQVQAVHSDIKDLIPTAALVALADNGFKDCSWSNDACPSFYDPAVEAVVLYARDHVDANDDRVSDKIVYALFFNGEFVEEIDDISSAITSAKACFGASAGGADSLI